MWFKMCQIELSVRGIDIDLKTATRNLQEQENGAGRSVMPSDGIWKVCFPPEGAWQIETV